MEKTSAPHYMDFFVEDPNKKDSFKCLICSKSYNGKKRTNLKNHAKEKHMVEYNNHMSTLNKKTLAIAKLKKLQQFTEIVTINGRPFKALSDTGFVKSQEDNLAELQKHGYGISLKDKSCAEVKSYISKTALKVKSHIRNEINGTLVSMMLDIASKHNESFLGIDIRFVSKGVISERTIGMIPLIDRHSAEYLSRETIKCAREFGVTSEKISSLTTDNGANVLAIVDHFDDFDELDINPDSDTDQNNDSFNTTEVRGALNDIDQEYTIANDEEIQRIADGIASDEAINDVLESTENYDELLSNIAGQIHHHSKDTQGIRCGGHVLQLIVRGGIKASDFNAIILLCRQICSLLSNQKYVYKMLQNEVYVIIPHKSNATRWDSDYRMVGNLIFFQQLKKIYR